MDTFHKAAHNNDIEMFYRCLKAGHDINEEDIDYKTPIYYACIGGHDEILDLLIDHGAEVNITYDTGWALVHYAIKGQIKNISKLLQNLHNVNLETDGELSLLYYVARYDKSPDSQNVKVLLDYGFDVNEKTDNGFTSIFPAMEADNIYGFKKLIEYGANPYILCGASKGMNIFHSVVWKKTVPIIENVFKNIDYSRFDSECRMLLFVAALRNPIKEVFFYIYDFNIIPDEHLNKAEIIGSSISNNRIDVFKFLLLKGFAAKIIFDYKWIFVESLVNCTIETMRVFLEEIGCLSKMRVELDELLSDRYIDIKIDKKIIRMVIDKGLLLQHTKFDLVILEKIFGDLNSEDMLPLIQKIEYISIQQLEILLMFIVPIDEGGLIECIRNLFPNEFAQTNIKKLFNHALRLQNLVIPKYLIKEISVRDIKDVDKVNILVDIFDLTVFFDAFLVSNLFIEIKESIKEVVIPIFAKFEQRTVSLRKSFIANKFNNKIVNTLRQSVRNNNLVMAQIVLEEFDIKSKFPSAEYQKLIIETLQYSSINMVSLLIDNFGNIEQLWTKPWDTIYSTNSLVEHKQIQLIDLLVSKGFNINAKCPDAIPIIHAAILCEFSSSVIEKMIKLGADLCSVDAYGDNALHCAIKYQRDEIVKLLFNNLINTNHKNNEYKTPLMTAISSANKRLINNMLSKSIDINVQDESERNCLFMLAETSDSETMGNLIGKGAIYSSIDMYGNTLLHHYVSNGRYSLVNVAIKATSINRHNYQKQTALHMAVKQNYLPIVKLLIAGDADLNLQDKYKCTPLHYAAWLGNDEMYECLIEAGANPKVKDKKGITPQQVRQLCGEDNSLIGSYEYDEQYKKAFDLLTYECNKPNLDLCVVSKDISRLKDSLANTKIDEIQLLKLLLLAIKYHRNDAVKYLLEINKDIAVDNHWRVLKTALKYHNLEIFNHLASQFMPQEWSDMKVVAFRPIYSNLCSKRDELVIHNLISFKDEIDAIVYQGIVKRCLNDFLSIEMLSVDLIIEILNGIDTKLLEEIDWKYFGDLWGLDEIQVMQHIIEHGYINKFNINDKNLYPLDFAVMIDNVELTKLCMKSGMHGGNKHYFNNQIANQLLLEDKQEIFDNIFVPGEEIPFNFNLFDNLAKKIHNSGSYAYAIRMLQSTSEDVIYWPSLFGENAKYMSFKMFYHAITTFDVNLFRKLIAMHIVTDNHKLISFNHIDWCEFHKKDFWKPYLQSNIRNLAEYKDIFDMMAKAALEGSLIDIDSTKFLYNKILDKYYMDEEGNTLLHYAAKNISEHVSTNIRLLCKMNVDFNARNLSNITPLEVAIRDKNFKAVVMLLNLGAGYDNTKEKSIAEILRFAAIHSTIEIYDLLSSKYTIISGSHYFLCGALRNTNKTMFFHLIETGITINDKLTCQLLLNEACRYRRVDVVSYLVKSNLIKKYKINYEESILTCINTRDLDSLRLIIEDAPNIFSEKPYLVFKTRFERISDNIVEYLLQSKIGFNNLTNSEAMENILGKYDVTRIKNSLLKAEITDPDHLLEVCIFISKYNNYDLFNCAIIKFKKIYKSISLDSLSNAAIKIKSEPFLRLIINNLDKSLPTGGIEKLIIMFKGSNLNPSSSKQLYDSIYPAIGEKMKYFLSKAGDVNNIYYKNNYGEDFTIFGFAVENQSIPIIEFCFDNIQPLNFYGEDLDSYNLIEEIAIYNFASVLNCVLNKINVNQLPKDIHHHVISKMTIEMEEKINVLSSYGFDIKSVDEAGFTLLHKSISEFSCVDYIDPLLECGIKIDAQTNYGNTALHMATACPDCVRKLLECGAVVDLANNDGETPLMCAVEKGVEASVYILIDSGADLNILDYNKQNCLHKLKNSNINILKYLLKQNIDTNKVDCHENTALHYLAKDGRVDLTEILLEHVSNTNAKNEVNMTSLHMAVKGGFISVVRLLLENGALVNLQDIHGFTPLHHAAILGNIEIYDILLDYGANDTITAVKLAKQYNQIELVNHMKVNDELSIEEINIEEAKKLFTDETYIKITNSNISQYSDILLFVILGWKEKLYESIKQMESDEKKYILNKIIELAVKYNRKQILQEIILTNIYSSLIFKCLSTAIKYKNKSMLLFINKQIIPNLEDYKNDFREFNLYNSLKDYIIVHNLIDLKEQFALDDYIFYIGQVFTQLLTSENICLNLLQHITKSCQLEHLPMISEKAYRDILWLDRNNDIMQYLIEYGYIAKYVEHQGLKFDKIHHIDLPINIATKKRDIELIKKCIDYNLYDGELRMSNLKYWPTPLVKKLIESIPEMKEGNHDLIFITRYLFENISITRDVDLAVKLLKNTKDKRLLKTRMDKVFVDSMLKYCVESKDDELFEIVFDGVYIDSINDYFNKQAWHEYWKQPYWKLLINERRKVG